VVLDYAGLEEQQKLFSLPPVMIRESALQISTHAELAMQIWTAGELLARMTEIMDAPADGGVSSVNRYFEVWKSWTADFEYILSHPDPGDIMDVFPRSALRGSRTEMFAIRRVTGVLDTWLANVGDAPDGLACEISCLPSRGQPVPVSISCLFGATLAPQVAYAPPAPCGVVPRALPGLCGYKGLC
jgi:hypothetical protein